MIKKMHRKLVPEGQNIGSKIYLTSAGVPLGMKYILRISRISDKIIRYSPEQNRRVYIPEIKPAICEMKKLE